MEREELPPPSPLPRNGPQTEKLTIYMIIRGPMEGDSNNAPRTRLDSIREWDMDRSVQPVFKGTTVKFNEDDWTHIQRPQTDALVIRADIGGCNVERIFVDTASSVDVMYLDCFRRMNLAADIKPVGTSLFGFAGEEVRVYGKMQLPMLLGDGQWRQYRMVNFMLIDSPYQYNVIMGRSSLSEYAAIISTAHLMMKFTVEDEKQRIVWIGETYGDQRVARRCYVASVRSSQSLKRTGETKRP